MLASGKDYPPWVRATGSAVGLALAIIGLGGLKDNLVGWAKFLDMIGISSDVAKWIIFVIGMALVVFVNRIPHHVVAFVRGVAKRESRRLLEPPPGSPILMDCPQCKTSTRKWGRYEIPCPKCKAIGFLPRTFFAFPICGYCRGNGRNAGRYEADCHICSGYGKDIPARLRQEWERLTREQAMELLGLYPPRS